MRDHERETWRGEDYEADLPKAEAMNARWQAALGVQSGSGTSLDPLPFEGLFGSAMNDDLNSFNAIRHLDELADAITGGATMGANVEAAQTALRMLSGMLGLRFAVT